MGGVTRSGRGPVLASVLMALVAVASCGANRRGLDASSAATTLPVASSRAEITTATTSAPTTGAPSTTVGPSTTVAAGPARTTPPAAPIAQAPAATGDVSVITETVHDPTRRTPARGATPAH